MGWLGEYNGTFASQIPCVTICLPFNSCLGDEITSLKNRLDILEAVDHTGARTALSSSISTNAADITSNAAAHASGISTNAASATANGNAITANGGLISTNAADITSNAATHASGISTNAADIAAVELEKGQKGASVTGAKGESGSKGAIGEKGDTGASPPILNCADATASTVCATCSYGFTGDGTAACDPIPQTLSWVSDAGTIDGNKFYASDVSGAAYEGAAVNHIFTDDFDILIKSTGNSHQGMGMTYGPAVATDADVSDYCTFKGAYQGGIKDQYNTASTFNGCGDNNGCGDTGYGCKTWAHATGTVFTGGYNWPSNVHAESHTGGRVVYSRFTRVGNVLTQKYLHGAANQWITGKTPSDITNLVTAYSAGSFTIPSSSGVMITVGEASGCSAISGGPANCPFVICAAGQTC